LRKVVSIMAKFRNKPAVVAAVQLLKDSADPAVRDELRALLADARADAVQYVHDVRADELRKAREDERERVLRRVSRPGEHVRDVREPPANPMAVSVRELSDADLLQALKNVGCHLDACDACAEVLFVGGSMVRHTCPRGSR
jgi:hypothetical protein